MTISRVIFYTPRKSTSAACLHAKFWGWQWQKNDRISKICVRQRKATGWLVCLALYVGMDSCACGCSESWLVAGHQYACMQQLNVQMVRRAETQMENEKSDVHIPITRKLSFPYPCILIPVLNPTLPRTPMLLALVLAVTLVIAFTIATWPITFCYSQSCRATQTQTFPTQNVRYAQGDAHVMTASFRPGMKARNRGPIWTHAH